MIVFNPWIKPGNPSPNPTPGGSILEMILKLLSSSKNINPPSK